MLSVYHDHKESRHECGIAPNQEFKEMSGYIACTYKITRDPTKCRIPHVPLDWNEQNGTVAKRSNKTQKKPRHSIPY